MFEQIALSVTVWLVVIFGSKHLSATVLGILKLSVALCLDTISGFLQLEHVAVDMATRTLSDKPPSNPSTLSLTDDIQGRSKEVTIGIQAVLPFKT